MAELTKREILGAPILAALAAPLLAEIGTSRFQDDRRSTYRQRAVRADPGLA